MMHGLERSQLLPLVGKTFAKKNYPEIRTSPRPGIRDVPSASAAYRICLCSDDS